MAKELLDVKQLFVNVEDKEILHGVDLKIGKGETHVLMGPNGAGKSTLGYALMGNPRYQLTNGEIWFQGKKINEEPVDKRAGMFLSFQSPLEVPGLSLSSFIRSALEQRRGERIRLWDFRKELAKAMELLQMDPSYADRDLNVGFSGGEKKKADPADAYVKAKSGNLRRDRLRSGRRCSPHCFKGRGRVSERQRWLFTDHHPQHPYPGSAPCRLHSCNGRWKDR